MTTNILPIDPKARAEGSSGVKARASTDRDTEGRRQDPEPEVKRHLTDEEFTDAIKALQETPGIATNNLKVRFETHGDHRVIFIEDIKGTVVRRLSEADLWLATREKDKPTGKIFDKAM